MNRRQFLVGLGTVGLAGLVPSAAWAHHKSWHDGGPPHLRDPDPEPEPDPEPTPEPDPEPTALDSYLDVYEDVY